MNNLPMESITRNLAVEMTARTGELWQAVFDAERNPQIQSPTACLTLSEDWRTHRLNIHASAPRHMREGTTGETITADPKRTAESIARDICSRILQHAREHLTKSKAYDEKTRKADAARQLRNNLIRRYCPREYQHEKFCTNIESASAYRERVYAETTYENLLHIEINLHLKDGLQLLKLLTKGKTQQ